MKIDKPWTKEEETFIFDNYKAKGINFCAEHLNRTVSSIKNKAFNLKLQTKTEKTGRRSKLPVTLKNIKGYTKTFANRKVCSEETNIKITCFSNLLNKGQIPKTSNINGWYDPQILDEPLYLLDDNDNVYKIEHFYEFCMKHSLETQYVKKILTGQMFHYKNFRKIGTPKKISRIKKYHVYISPDKIAYTVDNISKFSQKMNLHRQGFYSLNSSKINIYDKGWYLKNILFKDSKKRVLFKAVES